MIAEDKAMNWRRSYHEGIDIKIRDLKMERFAQAKRQVWIDHRCYSVANLTDAQIEMVARREAERDINRAIHEWNESRDRRHLRDGMAI